MRAPVGVQRCRGIGRPADDGQGQARRTSRVGDASRRSLVGINHLVSPVPSQTSRLSRRDRPGFTHSPTLRSSRGDRVSTKTENGTEIPLPFGCERASGLYSFPRGAKFLSPCVFVREVLLEKLLSSGAAIGRTCQESGLCVIGIFPAELRRIFPAECF